MLRLVPPPVYDQDTWTARDCLAEILGNLSALGALLLRKRDEVGQKKWEAWLWQVAPDGSDPVEWAEGILFQWREMGERGLLVILHRDVEIASKLKFFEFHCQPEQKAEAALSLLRMLGAEPSGYRTKTQAQETRRRLRSIGRLAESLQQELRAVA